MSDTQQADEPVLDGLDAEQYLIFLRRKNVLGSSGQNEEMLKSHPREVALRLFPEEIAASLRPMTQLEVENATWSIEQSVQLAVAKVEKEVLDRLARETRLLPTVYGGLTGIIAIVVGLLAAFNLMKYNDVSQLEEKTRLLTESLSQTEERMKELDQRASNAEAIVDSILVDLPIEDLIADTEAAMASVGLTLGDPATFERVRRTIDGIRRAASYADALPADVGLLLPYLQEVNGALSAMAGYKTQPTDLFLRSLLEKWRSLTPPTQLEHGRYADFLIRCRAYAKNVEGVILLTRFDVGGKETLGLLEEAKQCFRESADTWREFARPYINLAIVEKWRVEVDLKRGAALSDPETRTRLDRQLVVAKSRYREAMLYTRDAQLAAGLSNNIASLETLRADMLLRSGSGDRMAAGRMLEDARAAIAEARSQATYISTIFVTLAEIECVDLKLNEAEVAALSAAERSARLRRILDLLERAVVMGFTGFKSRTRDDFFRHERYFEYLRILDVNVEQQLFPIVGIRG